MDADNRLRPIQRPIPTGELWGNIFDTVARLTTFTTPVFVRIAPMTSMTSMTSTHPNLTARLMVGMEIHVELATRSKMWTSAPNVAHPDFFDAPPNSLLDPVVIGMPGTLPVMNKAALEMAMLVGLALNCEIARFSKWDRKSYYYPDLPKNYQLSQYDQPICGPGWVELPGLDATNGSKVIRILRAHLEEDAGKLLHEAPGGFAIDGSIIDLNRAGTPLLEIVTEPDFASADEAVTFAQMLRDICRSLGVTQGIMQKGHIRFEPNINVIIEKDGQTYKTPIVEIKNLNSFKAVHGAITHEYERQIDEWLETGRVMGSRAKSTRGWDDVKGVTTHQRTKEDADEYRYFPDPDLVPVVVSEEWIESLRAKLPELPMDREKRYVEQLNLDLKDANRLATESIDTAAFFDAIVATGADAKRTAKLLLNTAAKQANEKGVAIHELSISAGQVKAILDLVAQGKISSNGADELLAACCEEANKDALPEQLAQTRGLLQVSDTGALEGFVAAVLADAKNARAVADLQAGKDKAIGALMGQVMKLSKGQANPAIVTELIKKNIAAMG